MRKEVTQEELDNFFDKILKYNPDKKKKKKEEQGKEEKADKGDAKIGKA